MRAPAWWNVAEGPGSRPVLRALLSPLGWLYGAVTRAKLSRAGADVGVPVVCVGNASMGGAGKTPIVIYLLESFGRMGLEVAALTRGHGGAEAGPVAVRPEHSARDVGDEALLLGVAGPTWVSRDRVLGAAKALEAGADILVMDDGYQNPAIRKNLNILVVDAEVGFGNGHVFPAGPLRERPEEALARADAVVLMVPDADFDPSPALVESFGGLPVIPAWLSARERVPGGPLVAFAGIGRPEKFFATVERSGGTVVATTAFPDHHVFREDELAGLAQEARAAGATLITTDKDYVRLPAGFRKGVARLPVGVEFGDELLLRQVLHPVIARAKR